MTKFARFLSILFHPLLIPTFGFLVLFLTNNQYGNQSFELRSMLWVMIFTFTLVIPAILILLLKRFGVIKSLEMEHHSERIYPIMITFLSYFACIFTMHYFHVPLIFPLLLTGSIIGIGMVGMISIVWKISAHLTGYGGLLAATIVMALHLDADYAVLLSFLFIIGGLVGWARIYLNAHSVPQIFSGFIIGFASVFFPIILSVLFK